MKTAKMSECTKGEKVKKNAKSRSSHDADLQFLDSRILLKEFVSAVATVMKKPLKMSIVQ